METRTRPPTLGDNVVAAGAGRGIVTHTPDYDQRTYEVQLGDGSKVRRTESQLHRIEGQR